jgi:hypothetical protein
MRPSLFGRIGSRIRVRPLGVDQQRITAGDDVTAESLENRQRNREGKSPATIGSGAPRHDIFERNERDADKLQVAAARTPQDQRVQPGR